MSLQRKEIGIFLLIAFLTVSVAVIPNIVTDEMKAWCLQNIGPNYPRYLIVFFIFGSGVLVFLTSGFSESLFSNKREEAVKNANIPWSVDTATTVREAKAAIQNAVPEEALKKLFALKSPALDQELSLLANRLAYYQRESRLGVQTGEEKSTGYNRICRDILDLITFIETSLAASEKTNRELRDYLRQRYERRLKQKLAERQPVNLRRLVSTEGTSEETAAIFVPYGSDEIQDGIGKIFHDAYGRLLITGAPGAGKTTLLLQLAQSLLESEPDALPVVLNLATWQSSFVNLKTWLEEILPAELSTNKSAAKLFMQQSRLILLLDGLDEIKQEDRAGCLNSIGDYGMDAGQRFVITSRIAEYKHVLRDAPVNLQIEVGPLTLEQLEAELARTGYKQPEALPLLQAIKKDDLLRQAVQTPFYFNALQLLFAGRKTLYDLHFTADTEDGRQEEIKNRFINHELAIAKSKVYPPDRIVRWISFLSFQMKRRNKVVFELADLQYDWWRWSFSELLLAWEIKGLTHILIIPTCTFGLFIGLMVGLVYPLVSLLIYVLTYGLTYFMTYELNNFFEWLVEWLFQWLVQWPLFWFIGGLIGGGIGGMLMGIYERFSVGKSHWWPYITTKDQINWSLKMILHKKANKIFLAFWLVFGVGFGHLGRRYYGFEGGIIGMLIGMLIGTFLVIQANSFIHIIQIKTPYHRFFLSIKMLYFSILEHWFLRYQLSKKDLLPLRLVDFLNEMTARHLMETDGATWRFRHRIIQDHFAELWKEEEESGTGFSPQRKG